MDPGTLYLVQSLADEPRVRTTTLLLITLPKTIDFLDVRERERERENLMVILRNLKYRRTFNLNDSYHMSANLLIKDHHLPQIKIFVLILFLTCANLVIIKF